MARVVQLDSRGTDLQVTIPARCYGFAMFLLPVWLAFWTYGGAMVLRSVLQGTNRPEMVFWLVGWVLAELWAGAALAWQLFGREELVVGPEGIRYRATALGFSRRKSFSASTVKGLRVVPQPEAKPGDQSQWTPPLWGDGAGPLAFNYGKWTFCVGRGMDEGDATHIVAEIGKRFPRYVEKAPGTIRESATGAAG